MNRGIRWATVTLFVLLFGSGFALWLVPTWFLERLSRVAQDVDIADIRQLGAALLTGSIIGAALLFVEISMERAAQVREESLRLQAESEAQTRGLQLSLSLERNLSGVDLRESSLAGFLLRDKSLEEASLEGAELVGTDLSGSDMTGARCERADLSGAQLRGTKLTRTHFVGANLRGAALSGAKGQEVKGPTSYSAGAIFWGADLTYADLTWALFRGAEFAEANLSTARLYGSDFSDADFSQADLSEATCTQPYWRDEATRPRTDLTKAILANSTLFGGDLRWAILDGSDLTGAAYDEATQWPETVSHPEGLGAIPVPSRRCGSRDCDRRLALSDLRCPYCWSWSKEIHQLIRASRVFALGIGIGILLLAAASALPAAANAFAWRLAWSGRLILATAALVLALLACFGYCWVRARLLARGWKWSDWARARLRDLPKGRPGPLSFSRTELTRRSRKPPRRRP